jgi:hypothetical protein
MLSVEQFKLRLMRPNHPDWLLVGIDANDDSQLYIVSNGGIGVFQDSYRLASHWPLLFQ